MNDCQNRSCWEPVKKMMGDCKIFLGQSLSCQFNNSPRRILYSMSYYKFAAKLIGFNKRVLDVECGEGIGTWLLFKECGFAKGIDIDQNAIETARRNWRDPCILFECSDFVSTANGQWDAVVILDVIEHILPENVSQFFQKITDSLTPNGITIVGTPNISSRPYVSAVTKSGYVNLYSKEQLEKELMQYFSHVFMFAANDELVHTAFLSMAHYLMAVGCRKRL